MVFVIIGLGYFGKIIESKLQALSLGPIKTVDPLVTSDYANIDDVDFTEGYWFVTTPAITHYTIVSKLIEKGVKNIWVEKPICTTLESTLDIFAKLPEDVFLFCDFTWLKHSAITTMGDYVYKEGVKHMELKWLNDGTHIPKDVNIVLDLAIHPISIVTFLLMKNKDTWNDMNIVYSSKTSVIINGKSKKGVTFTIEVSNSSKKKKRSISVYSHDVLRWSSADEFLVENLVSPAQTDAIEANIRCFMNKTQTIHNVLDVARNLETVNEQFCLLNN